MYPLYLSSLYSLFLSSLCLPLFLYIYLSISFSLSLFFRLSFFLSSYSCLFSLSHLFSFFFPPTSLFSPFFILIPSSLSPLPFSFPPSNILLFLQLYFPSSSYFCFAFYCFSIHPRLSPFFLLLPLLSHLPSSPRFFLPSFKHRQTQNKQEV